MIENALSGLGKLLDKKIEKKVIEYTKNIDKQVVR